MAATATLEPTQEIFIPTPAAPISDGGAANYVDDRSTAAQVIVSLYNAVNRHEYLRAYSYWRDPANLLGSFDSFAASYEDTISVALIFGILSAGAGAGQIYYSVPVVVKATTANNGLSIQVGCYLVHQSQPGFYGAPPFGPMGIETGTLVPMASSVSEENALKDACSGSPNGGMLAAAEGASLDISKANFLDNRSGPQETVSSFLNALNLKQYVRAYYYMQNPNVFPGAYDPFAAGYTNTEVITATFGTAISDGAAGNIYYKQPVGMQVLTTSGAMQYFVGCYNLHISQPAVQATPPFSPLGITGGSFKVVTTESDILNGLTDACK